MDLSDIRADMRARQALVRALGDIPEDAHLFAAPDPPPGMLLAAQDPCPGQPKIFQRERDAAIRRGWTWLEEQRHQAITQMLGGSGGLYQPKREMPMLMELLKNLPKKLEGAVPDVDSLVELAAFGRAMRSEFELQEIKVPKWLTDNLAAISREIKTRHRAEKNARLLRLEGEIEALRSREEKKAELEAELAKLREELKA